VASKEGYQYLSSLSNIFGIRCGIAGGGACTTKNATGIYYPMGSLLEEIEMSRRVFEYGYLSVERRKTPPAIADGGINTPDRMCKALALGADVVIMGSVLAVAKESPAKKINGFTYRNGKRPYDPMGHVMTWGETVIDSAIFRGSASFEVQKEYREPRYIEGQEILLPYKGESLQDIITKFMSGLRSSMSYFNARTLEEFRTNVSYGIKQ
jgi:IMP dehydrogenase